MARVASRIVGDDHGGDIVQSAFVKALAARKQLRDSGRLKAWVWSIVLNEARDVVRRQPRGDELPEAPPAVVPEPDERGHEVRRHLAAMPERQRTVLFLRYYGDLTLHEIAAALGIRPGTVAATLHQAQQSLRSRLEGSNP